MPRLGFFLFFQLFATSPAPISRSHKVADGLYLSGQPERVGFEYLKNNGVKTIINLRIENDEEPMVRELGMNYAHIPIDNMKILSKIPQSAIDQYFKVLNDPANYPIFFHCQRGADRTGAMAGFYRITVDEESLFRGPRHRNALVLRRPQAAIELVQAAAAKTAAPAVAN
jgi:protein tyrosine/serine phosphatase